MQISAEDVVAEIAEAVYPVRPIASKFAGKMKRWLNDNIEEIGALDFRVKIRAGLDAGSWRRHGEQLIRSCAEHEKPVLLVIDELPIFLKRLLRREDGFQRVDEFLSWFRSVLQKHNDGSLVLLVSGSIGLKPLVDRLGLSDRINLLDPFRLGPWNREESMECFRMLAESYQLEIDDEVPEAVYNTLGIGIPHHIQSFFARLMDFAKMQGKHRIAAADVSEVYRNSLLGPSGQNDLTHYETRLKEGLEDENYSIAMEILAEAAVQGVFTGGARQCLDRLYSNLVDNARSRITNVLDVLEHDGYLESGDDGYRFPSRLLKDWWETRFRDHHTPLCKRLPEDKTT